MHHISKDFLLENGVSLRSVYEELTAFTDGCDMLSYNGNGYDAPILYYNLKRLGLKFDFEDRTWYDALVLERIHTAGKVDENGERLHNNLTSAYTRYYGHPFEGAHNSLDDVMATIEVFKAQVAAHGSAVKTEHTSWRWVIRKVCPWTWWTEAIWSGSWINVLLPKNRRARSSTPLSGAIPRRSDSTLRAENDVRRERYRMQIYVCFKMHMKRFCLLVGVLFEPEPAEKILREGQFIILRNGKEYTVNGLQIR